MEKVLILFNPSAGKGKAFKGKDRLEGLLRRLDIPCDLFVTQSEQELRDIAREHSEIYRTIVGVGGDSTFNIIINEIVKEGFENRFGMIGLGSSNDIVKEFQTDSLEKACLALKEGKTKKIDLGCVVQDQIPQRYYLGQANIGLGVIVNKQVEELARTKPRLGKRQTLAGVLSIIDSYRSKDLAFPLTVEFEGGRVEGEFILAVFSNIRYWATGKTICPDALPDDGWLDCCLINKCSLARLAYIAFLAKKGRHTGSNEVRTLRSRSFEISSPRDFEVQIDGEIMGGFNQPSQFKKIMFKIIPQALNIIC